MKKASNWSSLKNHPLTFNGQRIHEPHLTGSNVKPQSFHITFVTSTIWCDCLCYIGCLCLITWDIDFWCQVSRVWAHHLTSKRISWLISEYELWILHNITTFIYMNRSMISWTSLNYTQHQHPTWNIIDITDIIFRSEISTCQRSKHL